MEAGEAACHVVDLRSDTVTKPTPKMRKAMAEAEVGDDVYGEDPTVLKLQRLTAAILGKDAALFVPSGTMGNLSSIMAHCWGRGLEILVGDETHIYLYEQGGAAQLAGVKACVLRTKPDGTFDLNELRSKIKLATNDVHECHTGLICLENTNNRCGGAVLPTEYVQAVCRIAKHHGIPVHMDGARIFNAAVHLGQPVDQLVRDCDSVSMCLSKGLGTPSGSIVAGSLDFIKRVHRCRKVLGGAMRQVGILAAAGLVALEDVEQRLRADHRHSRQIAEAVINMKSSLVTVDMNQVQSNMVLLKLPQKEFTPENLVQKLFEVSKEEKTELGKGIAIKVMVWSSTAVRVVLHSDISEDDVKLVIRKMEHVIRTADAQLKSENSDARVSKGLLRCQHCGYDNCNDDTNCPLCGLSF